MTDEKPAPSGWRVEQAMSAWQSARARILADDAALEGDEAALSELLGDETGDVDSILARLLRASVHAGDMADVATERADHMALRAVRYTAREALMRGAAMAIMETMDRKKFELPDLTATVGKPRSSVEISDEAAIPEEYWKTTRSLDKAALRSDIAAGVVVPGAALEAGLPSFSIRTR